MPLVNIPGVSIRRGVLDNAPSGSALFKTSFDYGTECTLDGLLGGPSCELHENDGINWTNGSTTVDGQTTQAAVAANNSNGDGGMGARFWVGDGTNNGTSSLRLNLGGPEKELWIRWYQRYEAGFKWSSAYGGQPNFDKCIFLFTGSSIGSSPMEILPEYTGAGYRIQIQGEQGSLTVGEAPGLNWTDTFGLISDGLFHLFETHIKLDTDGTDGIAQMWIDGTLVINESGVDYSQGNPLARIGVYFLDFHSNQESPDNGRAMFVDYDDMEIWTTSPPNTDAGGNPWIGPLNSFSGGV